MSHLVFDSWEKWINLLLIQGWPMSNATTCYLEDSFRTLQSQGFTWKNSNCERTSIPLHMDNMQDTIVVVSLGADYILPKALGSK